MMYMLVYTQNLLLLCSKISLIREKIKKGEKSCVKCPTKISDKM